MDHLWLWATAGAALGFIATCWAHLRSFFERLQRAMIVERKLDVTCLLDEVFCCYLDRHARPGRLNDRCYQMWYAYVRPLSRWCYVVGERPLFEFKTYWFGWWPLWLTRSGDAVTKEGGANTPHREFVVCRYLRWTIDFERLLLDAVEEHSRRTEQHDEQTSRRRFHVYQVTGTASIRPMASSPQVARNCGESSERSAMQTTMPLGWSMDDIGDPLPKMRNALSTLALCPEAREIIGHVKRWLGAKEWYQKRSIPWRRSWLLSGPPGTGKTALIRALAQDLDLPVLVFHLHTLTDRELIEEWRTAKVLAPSIAVFEDIDAVFQGRESKNECLSFDTLLNCLDGVEESDGVLTFVTTNRPDSLDPALATASEATRPGRIDRVVHMGPLSYDGRLQICRRVLHEHPEAWGELAEQGNGETGAQFVCRCRNRAEQLFWSARSAPRPSHKEESIHEVNGKHLTLVFEQHSSGGNDAQP